jgi:hypothetical protein
MRNLKQQSLLSLVSFAALLAVAGWLQPLAFGAPNPSAPVQLSFKTPQQAAEALIKAAEANDVPALLKIFGPDGKDIVSSGDTVRDKSDRARFIEKVRQKMEVTFDVADPKRAVLIVGTDDWPMPVPIVEKQGKWRFDSKDGRREILARRIGGNELNAISLLRGYDEAQREYASALHDGSDVHQYAQKWISSQGKQDGLAWWGKDGKPAGPVGEEVANALAAGYTKKTEPYNGYYFKILTAQGPSARLGARDYIINGAMIGGFAAIAWPATYGVTGVQTFLVNTDGNVYQKDLGPDTKKIAPTIKTFNPDKSWTITKDEE